MVEEKLKNLILSRYPSITDFADACGVKYTTVLAILNRGAGNANILNVIAICHTLGISTEDLAEGKIVFTHQTKEGMTALEDMTSAATFLLNEGLVSYKGIQLSEDEKLYLLDTIELTMGILERKRK